MCGAIATKCITKDCEGMARYSLHCYECNKEEED
jgi:hypothetical protein